MTTQVNSGKSANIPTIAKPTSIKFEVFAFKDKDFYKEQIEPYKATNDAKIAEYNRLQAIKQAKAVSYTPKAQTTLKTALNGDKSEQEAMMFIFNKESGNRLEARNASGCLGLGQACPGSKLINACPQWATDRVCQESFFTNYAKARYGSWVGAYSFWIKNYWY